MKTQRTAAEIETDIARLEDDYAAAMAALKMTPHYDPQRGQWQATVYEYGSRKTNLIAELRSVNGRAKG